MRGDGQFSDEDDLRFAKLVPELGEIGSAMHQAREAPVVAAARFLPARRNRS